MLPTQLPYPPALPGLKYEEEGPLIELMVCAMKQAAEVTPPVGRSHGRKVSTDKRDRSISFNATQSSDTFHTLLRVSTADLCLPLFFVLGA